MKALLYVLLAIATVAGLSACRITSYGGYIGSGVYYDDHYYPGWGHSHHDGWGRREDNWNRNRLERIERQRYREQRPGGNQGLRPPRPRIGHTFALETTTTSDFVSTDSRVITVADKYDISDYAATYIVRAVELAKADDDSGIKDLGLTTEDFSDMMKGKDLSSDKLTAVASKLLMTTDAVEQMIFDIKNDVEYANQ